MNQWVNVTNTFSESQRHYKNPYLEICEVFDAVVEVGSFADKYDVCMPSDTLFDEEALMKMFMDL